MELIVFDLDGTLLNRASRISDFTRDTLRMLSDRDIAYTVATGRTLHGARAVLEGHGFTLPQAYKNGVLIWHPADERFSSHAMLTRGEVDLVVESCLTEQLTPLLFTLDEHDHTAVYHPPLRSPIEMELLHHFLADAHIDARPIEQLSPGMPITHVNALGPRTAISAVVDRVQNEPHLIAYSGVALEDQDWYWLDLHHSDASKGGAIQTLKELLDLERVICFGDSHNDLSMFEAADEGYAPANAHPSIKAAATEVIGHHDDEGIARFLRARFDLG